MTLYRNRREKIAKENSESVAIVFAHSHQTRSFDTEFSFRQNSNFFYLTGFHEPDAILVITSKPEVKSVLFVLPKDPTMELWTGKRTGKEQALSAFGVDQVFHIDEFEKELPQLLTHHREVLFDLFNQNETNRNVILKVMKEMREKRKSPNRSPLAVKDIIPQLGTMRLYKDAEEIEWMKKAAALSTIAHHAAMSFTENNKNENEVTALMEFLVKKNGSKSMAYESIVAGGNNANILHYINNDQVLKDGDLLLIDAGAEYNNYASDVTRTFPVNGKFSKIQKEIYEIVLTAQKECIKACVVGNTQRSIDTLARKIMTQGLMDLGILKDLTLDEHMEKGTLRKYYPHGTGHWIGLDVHDESPYTDYETLELITLSAGMVITIEPGLYFDADHEDTPESVRGIGIRIEDDILITNNGPLNLTEAIVKEVVDIEKQCLTKFIF